MLISFIKIIVYYLIIWLVLINYEFKIDNDLIYESFIIVNVKYFIVLINEFLEICFSVSENIIE